MSLVAIVFDPRLHPSCLSDIRKGCLFKLTVMGHIIMDNMCILNGPKLINRDAV